MTKNQIKCYITVVNEHSFTKAANVLYISQPAISKSISNMEEELGIPLIIRKGGDFSLTEAGEIAYEYFTKSEEEYRLFLEKIFSVRGKKKKPIRVGCPDTWNPSYFYTKIESYLKENYPETVMEIECCKLSDLIEGLVSGEIDVVFTHDFNNPYRPGVESVTFAQSGCGIVYSKERFGEVKSLEDIKGADFIVFDGEIQKKFETIIKEICSDVYVPGFNNAGQLSTAIFEMSCGKGVMLFSDWDSVVTNSIYGYYKIEKELPLKLMFVSERRNDDIDIIIEAVEKTLKNSGN